MTFVKAFGNSAAAAGFASCLAPVNAGKTLPNGTAEGTPSASR